MKKWLVLFTILISTSSFSAELFRDCFKIHVKEAMEINRHRRDFYAEMSGGKTRSISNGHIFVEKLIYLWAAAYDRKDRVYYDDFEKSPFCSILMDMATTPELQTELEFPEKAYQEITKKEMKAFKKDLKESFNKKDMKAFEAKIDAFMSSEKMDNPYFHCLVRHYLESIMRTSMLIPAMKKLAAKKGLKDPEAVMRHFIAYQVGGLSLGNHFDKLAEPHQTNGLRLFCRDNPFIPKPDLSQFEQ